MSKRRKTKRRRGEFYITFEFWELESAAFKHLSADATRVYLFMRKALDFDCSNNGHVIFSHRNAQEALQSSWRRGSIALSELVHYGFIKWRNGGVQGAAIRLACEWQLTAFPCGGQEASKTFMSWDGTVFEVPENLRSRVAKKQTPTGNTTTPRRQHDDASESVDPQNESEMPQTVGNTTTLSPGRRRQHEDTSTITREGGLDNLNQIEPVACRARPLARGDAKGNGHVVDYDNDAVQDFLTQVSRNLSRYTGPISWAETKTVRRWREQCAEIASTGLNPMHAKRARVLADALSVILEENGVEA
jgi:hypothetical protein